MRYVDLRWIIDEFPQGDRKVRGNINATEQKNLNSTLGDLGAG